MTYSQTSDLADFLSKVLLRTITIGDPVFEDEDHLREYTAMVYQIGEQEFIPVVFEHNRDVFFMAFETPSLLLEDAVDDATALKFKLREIRYENELSYDRGLMEASRQTTITLLEVFISNGDFPFQYDAMVIAERGRDHAMERLEDLKKWGPTTWDEECPHFQNGFNDYCY